MRRFLILIAAMTLFSTEALAEKPPAGKGLVARVIADMGTTRLRTRFRLDITDGWRRDDSHQQIIGNHPPKYSGWLLVRQLKIECLSGCDHPVEFQEETMDSPVSAFRLREDSAQFVTIWMGGSSYHIRIYDFGLGGIHKVLDAGCRSPPQFITLKDGRQGVVLADSHETNNDQVTQIHGTLWSWNGSTYVEEIKRPQ